MHNFYESSVTLLHRRDVVFVFTASMCHLKANELHKLAHQDSSGAIHYCDDLLKLGGHDGNRTQKNSYFPPSCVREIELELQNLILQGW